MLVNKTALAGVFVNLKTTFNKAFEEAPSHWQDIAMRIPSSASQNDYSWLSNFPKMREWIGNKVIKSFEAFTYTIVNKDWEATIEVDRNHIEDDQLGVYAPQAQMAGYSAKQLPDEIVFDLVNNAFNNKCYDGKAFCATNHPVGKAGVSNKGTAVLSCETLEKAKAGYGAARVAMRSFKDEEGRPLNITPDVLLVGPALEDTANALMNNDKLEDEKPNPYKGTARVVVDGHMTSDTAWFLLDTTKPVKPFIYQDRKKPTFVQQTNPDSENVFMRKKFLYGAEARSNGGYGFWQTAFGSTGEA